MNQANLKSCAPQARKDFFAAVTARAHQLGVYGQGAGAEGQKLHFGCVK
jgi:hypothetical protein